MSGWGWIEETTARWLRVWGVARGGESAGLDEGVRMLRDILPPRDTGKGRWGWRPQAEVEPALVTELGRQVVVGVALGDRLLDELSKATGRSRDDLLAELGADVAHQAPAARILRLRYEVEKRVDEMQPPALNAKFAGLGGRVERILRLAQLEAAEIREDARREAAGEGRGEG